MCKPIVFNRVGIFSTKNFYKFWVRNFVDFKILLNASRHIFRMSLDKTKNTKIVIFKVFIKFVFFVKLFCTFFIINRSPFYCPYLVITFFQKFNNFASLFSCNQLDRQQRATSWFLFVLQARVW